MCYTSVTQWQQTHIASLPFIVDRSSTNIPDTIYTDKQLVSSSSSHAKAVLVTSTDEFWTNLVDDHRYRGPLILSTRGSKGEEDNGVIELRYAPVIETTFVPIFQVRGTVILKDIRVPMDSRKKGIFTIVLNETEKFAANRGLTVKIESIQDPLVAWILIHRGYRTMIDSTSQDKAIVELLRDRVAMFNMERLTDSVHDTGLPMEFSSMFLDP
jgi:hypothetical protein